MINISDLGRGDCNECSERLLKDCGDHLLLYDLLTPLPPFGGFFLVLIYFSRRRLKMKKLNNENGRSMIEMLGVLAIIGVLSVGGIAGYSKAMQKYRINKTIEQITLIAGNVRSFFAPQKNYQDFSDITVLRKAKIIPDEMWDGNKIRDVWGNLISLSSYDNDKHYYISLSGLSEEACIELATKDWANIQNADAIQAGADSDTANFTDCLNGGGDVISAEGIESYSNTAVVCKNKSIPIDAAALACGACEDENGCYVSISFK